MISTAEKHKLSVYWGNEKPHTDCSKLGLTLPHQKSDKYNLPAFRKDHTIKTAAYRSNAYKGFDSTGLIASKVLGKSKW